MGVTDLYLRTTHAYPTCTWPSDRLKVRSVGEDSIKTAITHMNIGDLYLDWGKLDLAEHHAKIALRLRTVHRQVLGPTPGYEVNIGSLQPCP